MKATKVLYPVLAAVLVLGLCITVSAQQQADKDTQNGAVKASLRKAPNDMDQEGSEIVGSVEFHTNDEGELVARAHLYGGAKNTTFSVLLGAHADKPKHWTKPPEIASVTTDGQGKCSATFRTDVPEDGDGSTIYVQLILSGKRVSYATNVIEVPVKK